MVFVADCRADRADDNLASLAELRASSSSHGIDLAQLPVVVQLNHSDAPTAASAAAVATPLITWHADPAAVPVHMSAAPSGLGVFDRLKSISRLCLVALKRNGATG